ncbi:MAG: nickel-responsive transcriptional regulator NikR [Verrucomicrobia bacterium]|nr:nickel-responsive transcriptional regulator NikR [Verrucomicrobiota bacterium]
MERFSISMDDGLLAKFDRHLGAHGYSNRSEAVRDLVRKVLVDEEWNAGEEVVGVITLVFDHHQRQLQDKLTELQHDHHDIIISSTHVHLDHHNCLEVIIVRGVAGSVRELADQLKATRGVKSSELTAASTGRRL